MAEETRYDEYGNPYTVEVDDAPSSSQSIDALRAAIVDRYQRYLNRTPDESEIVAHLGNPGGIEAIGALITSSPEYQDKTQQTATSTSITPRPGGLEEQYAREVAANTRNAADLRMARMIDRDRGSWEAAARAAAAKAGVGYDPSDLEGIIRNLSYAANDRGGSAGDAATYLRNLEDTYRVRAASGGDRAVGGYDTNLPDDPTQRAAALAAQAAKPSTTTMANILPRSGSVYTPTPVAAQTPYSARAVPTTPTAAPVTATAPQTAPVPAWTPSAAPVASPYRGTMATLMSQPGAPAAPSWASPGWNATDQIYRGALRGAAQAEPWTGIRETLARGPGAPRTADDEARLRRAEQQRAYRFGQQEALAQQQNAAQGRASFDNQMDNWMRAYEAWNQRGRSSFSETV